MKFHPLHDRFIMQIQVSDMFLVIALATFNTALSEFVSWLWVYRTKKYKDDFKRVEDTAARLEKLKSKGGAAKKSTARKLKDQEKRLKECASVLQWNLMKPNLVVAFFFIATSWNMSSYFGARPVAKLPFVPVSFLTSMSHRNLAGDDMTDCSMHFFLIMISIAIRSNAKKLLGVKRPKGLPGAGISGAMEQYEAKMAELTSQYE